MKQYAYKTLAISAALLLGLVVGAFSAQAFNLSSSKIKIKHAPPLHMNHEAVDLIDIARLPLAEGSSQIAQINTLIQRLGDYLTAAGHEVLATAKVTAKPLAADGSVPYAYGNWIVKTAESTGVRLLEVRISDLEEELLQNNSPYLAAALPYRYIIVPDVFFGRTFLHICAVDPLLYGSQFTIVDDNLRNTLIAARGRLCELARGAFPEAYYDPQLPQKPAPVNNFAALQPAALVNLVPGGKYETIEDVVAAVQMGSVTMLNNSTDEHPYTVNHSAFADYDLLDDEATVFAGTFSFPLFSMIKDGWKKIDGVKTYFPEWALANHSSDIEALIRNSFIHVYGSSAADPKQRLRFETPDGPVYTLQVFDAYTHPLLLHSGLWHYQCMPITILFKQISPTQVAVMFTDPVVAIPRYFGDVNDALLASYKEAWDANPGNKTDWPETGKIGIAVASRDQLLQNLRNALYPELLDAVAALR